MIWALLLGYAFAAIPTHEGNHYVNTAGIDSAPGITFLWTETWPLGFHGPSVLPTLIAVIVTTMESIGDITATAVASNLDTEVGEGCAGEGVSRRGDTLAQDTAA